MKKIENKLKTKKHLLLKSIISILIVLPLCYLVHYINAEDVYACQPAKNLSANTVVPQDSSLIKLQSALDLIKTNPTEDNYINLSYHYYMNAMYNECVTAAQKAITLNALSYSSYNNLCCAYNMLGKWTKAIAAGKKALEINKGDQLATNNLAVSVYGKEKQDKEIAAAETLVKHSPSEVNYLDLGYLYYMSENFDLSISTYKKVIEINKKSVIAYNNICAAYNELGKYKEAKEYCETAIKIDSTFSLAKNNLKVSEDKLKP